MSRLVFCFIIFLFILESCTKTVTDALSSNATTASIWPMKAGNTWIYSDSIFDASSKLLRAYSDSSFITDKTISIVGNDFYAFNDSLGWFGSSSYIAVDVSNTSLYTLDSINAASPYLFFTVSAPDPLPTETDALYSFASTYTINGYTCYKNVEQEKDEEGNVVYANVYYVSPGVGLIRIEEYSLNSNNNSLYLDYSQKLKSYQLK